jgi:hypothetical protein
MNRSEIWKNFRLGEELDISGVFIYNGMRRFHEIRKLDQAAEIFEFLYSLSVGLERLLKIAVVLIEHNDSVDQNELEKSLITHSHLDLLSRIKKHEKINFSSSHNELLGLLGNFYKSLRYDRFSLTSTFRPKREIEAICDFLSKHLRINTQRNSPLLGIENEERFKKFVRNTVLKISTTLYKIIQEKASSLNLYTYELRHGSKAETVFLRKVNVNDEDVLWKELLIFFMNTKSSSGYLEFLRGIKPLDFDPELVGDYLDCFQSDSAKAFVMDELEHHYEELEEKGKRLEEMGVIAAPNVFFDTEEDEEDFGL